MSYFRKRALLGAVLTTSAIVAAPAAASAKSLPAPEGSSGEVRLALTGGAAASLDRQNVDISVTSPATHSDDLLTFPTSDFRTGYQRVLTTNDGTLTFKKGKRQVTFQTLSTHLSNRIRVRASIDGETRTVLTANRKKTRISVDPDGTLKLNATHLRLTSVGAREIRRGLKLERLGRGTLGRAYGAFRIAAPKPAPTKPSPTPAPVATPGKLVWTQLNLYDTAAAPNVDHTWLGYVTDTSRGPGSAGGTFTPSDGAVGPTVTPDSERGAGAVYTTTFPMSSSTANAATKTGSIQYTGLVTFSSTAHGFRISIRNPRVVFDGSNVAKLFATGERSPGVNNIEPYDESQPVFTLDLSGATTVANADNTTTFSNVAPTVAATGHVFPAGARGYPAGAGPDRTPNTFGSFNITVPNP